MRSLPAACSSFLAALVLAGCAGSDADGSFAGGDVATTVTEVVAADEPIRDAEDGRGDDPDEVEPSPSTPWAVSIEAVAQLGADEREVRAGSSLTFDPLIGRDPFGEAAACSGLRRVVGAYSVFVSDGSGSFVGAWTVEAVDGGGIFEAEINLERPGISISAIGTMSLDDDLQAGSFVGFTPDGGSVEGRFGCAGTEPPQVLQLGDPLDGDVDSIEVFALLRDGASTRVVGLATDGPMLAACPAVESDPVDDVVVRADGGESLGSIRSFELTEASLRLAVGGTLYDFDDVELLADGAAGAFGAVGDDGIAIDGAYRCT